MVEEQLYWYITRSAALVAWVSAAVSVLLGVLIPSRLLGRRPTIPWLTDIHRFTGSLAAFFVAVHMVSLWADSFVYFSWAELFVPWVADVSGLTGTSIALGVIATWFLIAVQVSSWLRDHLPERLWYSIHLLSYGTLVLGTIHALQAGSDVDNPLVLAVGTSLLLAVVLASAVRLVRHRQHHRPLAEAGPADRGRRQRPRQPAGTTSGRRRPEDAVRPGPARPDPGRAPGAVPTRPRRVAVEERPSDRRPPPPAHRRRPGPDR